MERAEERWHALVGDQTFRNKLRFFHPISNLECLRRRQSKRGPDELFSLTLWPQDSKVGLFLPGSYEGVLQWPSHMDGLLPTIPRPSFKDWKRLASDASPVSETFAQAWRHLKMWFPTFCNSPLAEHAQPAEMLALYGGCLFLGWWASTIPEDQKPEWWHSSKLNDHNELWGDLFGLKNTSDWARMCMRWEATQVSALGDLDRLKEICDEAGLQVLGSFVCIDTYGWPAWAAGWSNSGKKVPLFTYPGHMAAANGRCDVVDFIAKKGYAETFSRRDANSATAFDLAVNYGKVECFSALCKHAGIEDASKLPASPHLNSLRFVAVHRGDVAMVRRLAALHMPFAATTVINDEIPDPDKLAVNGLSTVDDPNTLMMSPLLMAAWGNDAEMVDVVVETLRGKAEAPWELHPNKTRLHCGGHGFALNSSIASQDSTDLNMPLVILFAAYFKVEILKHLFATEPSWLHLDLPFDASLNPGLAAICSLSGTASEPLDGPHDSFSQVLMTFLKVVLPFLEGQQEAREITEFYALMLRFYGKASFEKLVHSGSGCNHLALAAAIGCSTRLKWFRENGFGHLVDAYDKCPHATNTTAMKVVEWLKKDTSALRRRRAFELLNELKKMSPSCLRRHVRVTNGAAQATIAHQSAEWDLGCVVPILAELDEGELLLQEDKDGFTPAWWAASYGSAAFIHELARLGGQWHASLKTPDRLSGLTPAHQAKAKGGPAAVQALWENDAAEGLSKEDLIKCRLRKKAANRSQTSEGGAPDAGDGAKETPAEMANRMARGLMENTGDGAKESSTEMAYRMARELMEEEEEEKQRALPRAQKGSMKKASDVVKEQGAELRPAVKATGNEESENEDDYDEEDEEEDDDEDRDETVVLDGGEHDKSKQMYDQAEEDDLCDSPGWERVGATKVKGEQDEANMYSGATRPGLSSAAQGAPTEDLPSASQNVSTNKTVHQSPAQTFALILADAKIVWRLEQRHIKENLVQLDIPLDAVSRIIGKEGSKLNEIVAQSGPLMKVNDTPRFRNILNVGPCTRFGMELAFRKVAKVVSMWDCRTNRQETLSSPEDWYQRLCGQVDAARRQAVQAETLPMYDNDGLCIRFEFSVPSDASGYCMGEKGSRIHQIEKQTGASITVREDAGGGKMRGIVVDGTRHQGRFSPRQAFWGGVSMIADALAMWQKKVGKQGVPDLLVAREWLESLSRQCEKGPRLMGRGGLPDACRDVPETGWLRQSLHDHEEPKKEKQRQEEAKAKVEKQRQEEEAAVELMQIEMAFQQQEEARRNQAKYERQKRAEEEEEEERRRLERQQQEEALRRQAEYERQKRVEEEEEEERRRLERQQQEEALRKQADFELEQQVHERKLVMERLEAERVIAEKRLEQLKIEQEIEQLRLDAEERHRQQQRKDGETLVKQEGRAPKEETQKKLQVGVPLTVLTDGAHECKFRVPEASVKHILGARGQHIKHLRTVSNAVVKLHNRSKSLAPTGKDDMISVMMVSVAGSLDEVGVATCMLAQVLEAWAKSWAKFDKSLPVKNIKVVIWLEDLLDQLVPGPVRQSLSVPENQLRWMKLAEAGKPPKSVRAGDPSSSPVPQVPDAPASSVIDEGWLTRPEKEERGETALKRNSQDVRWLNRVEETLRKMPLMQSTLADLIVSVPGKANGKLSALLARDGRFKMEAGNARSARGVTVTLLPDKAEGDGDGHQGDGLPSAAARSRLVRDRAADTPTAEAVRADVSKRKQLVRDKSADVPKAAEFQGSFTFEVPTDALGVVDDSQQFADLGAELIPELGTSAVSKVLVKVATREGLDRVVDKMAGLLAWWASKPSNPRALSNKSDAAKYLRDQMAASERVAEKPAAVSQDSESLVRVRVPAGAASSISGPNLTQISLFKEMCGASVKVNTRTKGPESTVSVKGSRGAIEMALARMACLLWTWSSKKKEHEQKTEAGWRDHLMAQLPKSFRQQAKGRAEASSGAQGGGRDKPLRPERKEAAAVSPKSEDSLQSSAPVPRAAPAAAPLLPVAASFLTVSAPEFVVGGSDEEAGGSAFSALAAPFEAAQARPTLAEAMAAGMAGPGWEDDAGWVEFDEGEEGAYWGGGDDAGYRDEDGSDEQGGGVLASQPGALLSPLAPEFVAPGPEAEARRGPEAGDGPPSDGEPSSHHAQAAEEDEVASGVSAAPGVSAAEPEVVAAALRVLEAAPGVSAAAPEAVADEDGEDDEDDDFMSELERALLMGSDVPPSAGATASKAQDAKEVRERDAKEVRERDAKEVRERDAKEVRERDAKEVRESPGEPGLDEECIFCMDNARDWAVVPCGHLALCGDCAVSQREIVYCPICATAMRAPYFRRVKVVRGVSVYNVEG